MTIHAEHLGKRLHIVWYDADEQRNVTTGVIQALDAETATVLTADGVTDVRLVDVLYAAEVQS